MPSVGHATVSLLEKVGLDVHFDARQTCCGQAAFNAGHPEEAVAFARHFLEVFADKKNIVSPSGSCVAMVRKHYGLLGLTDEEMQQWNKVKDQVFEVSEFLAHHDLLDKVSHTLNGKALVHYTCHHLRMLEAQDDMSRLLGRIQGLDILKADQQEMCCGFGGVFSMKLPQLSIAMAQDRIRDYLQHNPDLLVMADAGCMMQLEGVMKKMDLKQPLPKVVHYVELFDMEDKAEEQNAV